VVYSRAHFQKLMNAPGQQLITTKGPDSYQISDLLTPPAGIQGLLLLTGRGPFDPKLIAAPVASRGPDWAGRVAAAAKAGGWKAEMVWIKTVAPG
jgi:serine/threonine-protein kinase